jgi:hypothetical protein
LDINVVNRKAVAEFFKSQQLVTRSHSEVLEQGEVPNGISEEADEDKKDVEDV